MIKYWNDYWRLRTVADSLNITYRWYETNRTVGNRIADEVNARAWRCKRVKSMKILNLRGLRRELH